MISKASQTKEPQKNSSFPHLQSMISIAHQAAFGFYASYYENMLKLFTYVVIRSLWENDLTTIGQDKYSS